MFIKRDYLKSKRLYAFDRSTWTQKIDSSGGIHWSVDAIATHAPKGNLFIYSGRVTGLRPSWINKSPRIPYNNFDEAISWVELDGDYSYEDYVIAAKWDGKVMWAGDGAELTFMNQQAQLLEPFRLNLPTVPQGYDGWYAKV